MAESLAAWLALREPADAAARSAVVTQAVVEALPTDRPLRLLDLATGTGSNVRFLAARLPGSSIFPGSPSTPPGASPGPPIGQDWVAVDRDPVLLAHVPPYATTRCLELGSLDDPGLFSGRHLVTASALLDLVSASWMVALVEHCRAAGAAGLFALNYDGRSRCWPREPEDDVVLDLFNRHQRASDKGFGVAAGPAAADCVSRCFAAAGYSVRRKRSDWELAPAFGDLQRVLIAGWGQAAAEIAPDQADLIGSWTARRLEHVDHGRSRIHVGHQDVAVWLPK